MASSPGRPALLRLINDRAAFDLLLRYGALSRSDLSRHTGLAHPTAASLMERMSERGLVLSAGTAEGGRGPNAKLFTANTRAAHVAAVDLTPERLTVAVADLSGKVLATVSSEQTTQEHLRPMLAEAAHEAGLRTKELFRIVVGSPGARNPRTGALGFAQHMPDWREPVLAGLPATMENDVNLAALAEQSVGVARGIDSFVWLWLDTGLGMALVLDGRVRTGATGSAGEVSYLPVPDIPLGRTVRTGGHGGYQLIAGAEAVEELAACFDDGWSDEGFLRALATRVATGLAAVVCVLDPELVVLGGRIAERGGDRLLALLAEELDEVAVSTPALAHSTVPDNPVLIGALLSARTAALDALFAG